MTNKLHFFKNNCMQCKMTKNFWIRKVLITKKLIDEQPDIDYVKGLGFTSAPVIKAGDISFQVFNQTN